MSSFYIQNSFHSAAYSGDSDFGIQPCTSSAGLVRKGCKIDMYIQCLLFLVLSTLFPQPWYRGPTKVIELTGSTFRERVLLKQAKSTPKIQEVNEDEEEIKYWVVMLYANWSVACLNFESVLAKLSVEYSAPHIKFAKIDVDIYSDLAEEYGVSKDPASFDLPTLVLFHQGKEIRRLPELTVTKEGQTTSKADAAKNTITRLGWNKKPVIFFF